MRKATSRKHQCTWRLHAVKPAPANEPATQVVAMFGSPMPPGPSTIVLYRCITAGCDQLAVRVLPGQWTMGELTEGAAQVPDAP